MYENNGRLLIVRLAVQEEHNEENEIQTKSEKALDLLIPLKKAILVQVVHLLSCLLGEFFCP